MKIIAVLNLIITAQALFLCFHFMVKKKGVKVLNGLLACLSFCFSIIAFNTYINLEEMIPQDSFIQDIANNLMWFIGPTLYLYVIYNEKEPNQRFIYLNTSPYIVLACINIFFDWIWFEETIPFVAFTQMSIYLFLSIKYCLDNYTKAKQYYNWILPSIIAFASLIAVNFSLSVLETMGFEILSDSALQSFTSLLVIPIFYLAYKEMNSTNDLGITPRKYQTSQITQEKSKQYLAKIEAAMKDDHVYLQKNVTLQTFSQHVNITPKFISQTINENLKMSFSEYLFKFRFEDVKKRLVNPQNKHLTIYGIAQESGFNSNSRFNYLFKKNAGLTPKEYQKQHLK